MRSAGTASPEANMPSWWRRSLARLGEGLFVVAVVLPSHMVILVFQNWLPIPMKNRVQRSIARKVRVKVRVQIDAPPYLVRALAWRSQDGPTDMEMRYLRDYSQSEGLSSEQVEELQAKLKELDSLPDAACFDTPTESLNWWTHMLMPYLQGDFFMVAHGWSIGPVFGSRTEAVRDAEYTGVIAFLFGGVLKWSTTRTFQHQLYALKTRAEQAQT
jgi:hypothetical protein